MARHHRTLCVMGLSASFLVELFRRYDAAGMRQLARLILEGRVEQPPEVDWRPEKLLFRAAAAGDRKAGWLLCHGYLNGWGELQPDMEKARYWMQRTERRLRSDAALLYAEPSLKAEAVDLYARWSQWLTKHWPATGAAAPTEATMRDQG